MTLQANDPRHGTANGYSNLGCRCDECRTAWANYFRESAAYRKRHPLEREVYLASVRKHGTTAYIRRDCRCAVCVEAMRKRWREYREEHRDEIRAQDRARYWRRKARAT